MLLYVLEFVNGVGFTHLLMYRNFKTWNLFGCVARSKQAQKVLELDKYIIRLFCVENIIIFFYKLN